MIKRILLFTMITTLIFTNWYYYNAYYNEVDGRLANSTFHGLLFEIEYHKGDVRSGVSADGIKWQQKMHFDYGQFKNIKGNDNEPLDFFMKSNDTSGKIFRVIQLNVLTGRFDEYKIMIGFDSIGEAKMAYLLHYPDGWSGYGGIEEISIEEIK
tara:strand:- start:2285 stop:2746 length:462 start_codon:yes stop_codon:yes gene_type:complete